MRTLVIRLALPVLAVFVLASCEDEEAVVCVVDGVTHAAGTTFPSADGCNTCACGSDGVVACTARACVTTCTYEGVVHQVGDTFPAGDDCNDCSCAADGIAQCTQRACPATCDYGGVTYEAGDTFPASDGCNTCSCDASGTLGCTTMECQATCTYDRQTWEVGETFPAIDGCNTCTCEAKDQLACTELTCPTTCTYDRQEWQIGDTFPAIDGCNTCECQTGGVIACTEEVCACDPATDWWRSYVATSPEECLVVRFECPEHTTMFSNACGCGCEQADTCAREIDCWDGVCDPTATAATCPYSTVDTTRDCTVEDVCPADGSSCAAPGAPFGCGICQNPPDDTTCASDDDCKTTGDICEPLTCACAGQKTCRPGCADDAACAEGEACGADGRCAPRACGPATDACPVDFACTDGACARLTCDANADCDGYCVDGRCWSAPGDCRALPQ